MGLVTPTEPVPLDELGRVHFVGIGGAGMSGIARIMLARGTQSGRQRLRRRPRPLTSWRRSAPGSTPATRPARSGTPTRWWCRVRSGRATPSWPRRSRRGLRVLHRAAALASLMAGRRVTAVTGTHGKTTTTSMVATVLLETGASPAYAIGGVLAATGTGAADGQAGTSWPRRTRATARSSCTRRTWPSSPTWRPTTSTTTGPRRPTGPRSAGSSAGSSPAACLSPPPTTRARGTWPAAPAPAGSAWSPSASQRTRTTGWAA